MRRTSLIVDLGGNLKLYKTKIFDQKSIAHTQDSLARQKLFLHAILTSPDILNCGYRAFDKVSIYHTGEEWVAEAECLVEDETGEQSTTGST